MSAKENEGENTYREYLEWYTKHEPECLINHEGSAQVKILMTMYFKILALLSLE